MNDYVRGNQFREVVHSKCGKDLLEDVIRLFCMEMDEADRVFELAKGGFDTPALCVQKFELHRRKRFGIQIRNNGFKRRIRQPEANNTERKLIKDDRIMLTVFWYEIV